MTPLERAKELADLLRSHGNPADGCVACLEQAITAAVAEERESLVAMIKAREEAHYVNVKNWGYAGDERAESTSIQLAAECAIIGDTIRARGAK